MNVTMNNLILPEAIISEEKNVVTIRFRSSVKIELRNAERIVEKVGNIISYSEYALLVDARDLFFISSEARKFFGNRKHKNIKANALLVSTNLQKNFARMYLKFAKPEIKTQIFSDEIEARDWLKVQVRRY